MNRTIYIVEDHEVVRESYQLFLEAEDGLEVCGAVPTAEAALEDLQACTPDVLLIDVSLPGMSGIELLSALRDGRRALPAIVVTGHDHVHYRRLAHAAGARGFVLKADGPDALLAAIHEVLDASPDGLDAS